MPIHARCLKGIARTRVQLLVPDCLTLHAYVCLSQGNTENYFPMPRDVTRMTKQQTKHGVPLVMGRHCMADAVFALVGGDNQSLKRCFSVENSNWGSAGPHSMVGFAGPCSLGEFSGPRIGGGKRPGQGGSASVHQGCVVISDGLQSRNSIVDSSRLTANQ